MTHLQYSMIMYCHQTGHVFPAEGRDIELGVIERGLVLKLYVLHFGRPRLVVAEIQINRSMIINGPELGTSKRSSKQKVRGMWENMGSRGRRR